MLLNSLSPIERKDPRKLAQPVSDRRRHFEALFARSYAEMRARSQPA